MSWLLKYKPWITMVDAAAYLTDSTGEKVTEADLLLLAVEGQLRIAARFAETVTAVAGTIMTPLSDSFSELIQDDMRPLFPGIEGIFELRLTEPPTIRLNSRGEIESRTFGLEFNTAAPDRVVRITTHTLPPSAHWVVTPAVLQEFETSIRTADEARTAVQVMGMTDIALASMESDAALGAATRQRLKQFAARPHEDQDEREAEYQRWRDTAAEIQSERARTASVRELAQLVKARLKLPDSSETIRKRL